MNENQQNFLDDLSALLYKYNVDAVYPCEGRIMIMSNGNELSINIYRYGVFRGVKTSQDTYKPREV